MILFKKYFIVLLLFLLMLLYFRFDIVTTNNVAYKLDRLTGEVTILIGSKEKPVY